MRKIDPNVEALYNFNSSYILKYYNQKAKNKLTADQFTLSAPVFTRSTGQIIKDDTRSTSVTFEPVSGKGMKEPVVVEYDRIPIFVMTHLFTNVIRIPDTVKDTYELLPWILSTFGIALYELDFENVPIRWYGDKGYCSLISKDTSYVYIGRIEVEVIKLKPSISNILEKNKLPSFAADTLRESDKIDITHMFDTVDCQAMQNYLKNFPSQYIHNNPNYLYKLIKQNAGFNLEHTDIFNDPSLEVQDPNKIDLNKILYVYCGPTKDREGTAKVLPNVLIFNVNDQVKYTGQLCIYFTANLPITEPSK